MFRQQWRMTVRSKSLVARSVVAAFCKAARSSFRLRLRKHQHQETRRPGVAFLLGRFLPLRGDICPGAPRLKAIRGCRVRLAALGRQLPRRRQPHVMRWMCAMPYPATRGTLSALTAQIDQTLL
jgi:hypothetical protein